MGHPTDIFLNKPDDSIICAICHDVLKDPACFKECGHTFCGDCAVECLSATCPTCRVSVHTGSNPTYILRDLIGKLEVRCPEYSSDRKSPMDDGQKSEAVERSSHDDDETGCDWKGTISELDQHLADECPLTTIECGEDGCKHTCQRRHMAAHKSSQQGIIAHMKLKHQNELTATKLEYEDKLAAMEKKYKEKRERMNEWMNQRILEVEEQLSDVLMEIKVEGAGIQEVNGTYHRCGQHDGAPKFIRSTRYNEQPVVFTLFRFKRADGKRRWYISIVPENQHPGTQDDIDFYLVCLPPQQQGHGNGIVPPRDGWISIFCFGKGYVDTGPPPTVVYLKGGKS